MSIEKDKDGNIILNVGKSGELNHNGRVYLDGSKISAKHVNAIPRIIDENMMPVPSTKIVEDEMHFEKCVAIPPESDVTHYGYDGSPLDKLAMKNEYKFESWQKAMKENPGDVLEIDSLGGVTGEIKGVQLNHTQKPVKILYTGPRPTISNQDWGRILDAGRNIPVEDIFAAMEGDVQIVHIDDVHCDMSSPRKTMLGLMHAGYSPELARFSDMEGYSRHYFPVKEKEVTPTVSTNGRQKIIDNGKRQWPEAKRRKGHRKG
ncbi:hypothetical protein pETSU_103 [Edwardsiella phage pEt-SU]|uniref:Uncharacterized protein n=1 Tax=Edwardsiella phage pEt-SU TaxID=2562142 RepID=A0A4D6DWJ8_9CAUD|nr:hypothetical protein HOV39_gp103 [Edwardsiella phage pEt-SU]QBZ70684.1 hypothetical protein pETSU_103 [Edwardsiella phage pEt-SU]